MSIDSLEGVFQASPAETGLKLKVHPSQIIRGGDEGNKFLGFVSGNEAPSRTMFLKKMSPGILKRHPEALWENVHEKHKLLLTSGLPVVTTIMYDPQILCYLLSDATEGGRFSLIDKHSRSRGQFELITNASEIIENIYQISEAAFAGGNGILLSDDAFVIQVESDHVGQVAISDIIVGSYKIQNGTSPLIDNEVATIKDAKLAAQRFLSSIDEYLLFG